MTPEVPRTGASEAHGFPSKVKSRFPAWPQLPAPALGIWDGPGEAFLSALSGGGDGHRQEKTESNSEGVMPINLQPATNILPSHPSPPSPSAG